MHKKKLFFGVRAEIRSLAVSANRIVSMLARVSDGRLPGTEAAALMGTSAGLIAPLGQLLAPLIAKRAHDKDNGERGQRRRELRKARAAEAARTASVEAAAAHAVHHDCPDRAPACYPNANASHRSGAPKCHCAVPRPPAAMRNKTPSAGHSATHR